MSRTVIFDGVYPDRRRCSAVEDPIVPPPPTTMTFVVFRELAMVCKDFLGSTPRSVFRAATKQNTSASLNPTSRITTLSGLTCSVDRQRRHGWSLAASSTNRFDLPHVQLRRAWSDNHRPVPEISPPRMQNNGGNPTSYQHQRRMQIAAIRQKVAGSLGTRHDGVDYGSHEVPWRSVPYLGC